jgi:hypothetical protein
MNKKKVKNCYEKVTTPLEPLLLAMSGTVIIVKSELKLRKLWPHLNPYHWHIWHSKNCQKRIKIEKVRVPRCTWDQVLKENKPRNGTKL